MSDKTKTFFKRLFSTVILLSLLGGAVAWNNVIGYGVLLCLFCNLTTWEWFVMLKETPACRKLGLAMGLVYPWLLFAVSHATQAYMTSIFPLGYLVFFALLAFFVNLFCMDYKGRTGREALESMGLTLLAFIYPVWLFAFALGALGHFIWHLLWLILFTKMSDIWAYVSGVLMGGRFFSRKFSPTVSPKKTWEGIIGSFILTLTAGWFLLQALVPEVTADGPTIAAYLLCGAVLFVLSVAGDLAGSLIKRGLAVKDSGSLLPGIGGIFDLIDSPAFTVSFVMAACPVFGLLLAFLKH
ncbi:MAG: phosphatidate cytidylyltransferase [Akkermansia sp.]|nr:phosphatidate cytidylyltransferase [Akkermansia sp.]